MQETPLIVEDIEEGIGLKYQCAELQESKG